MKRVLLVLVVCLLEGLHAMAENSNSPSKKRRRVAAEDARLSHIMNGIVTAIAQHQQVDRNFFRI